jgi:hypothetical protein
MIEKERPGDGPGQSWDAMEGDQDQRNASIRGVRRSVLHRQGTAQCVTCGREWRNVWALRDGVDHARRHGHVVDGAYRASYRYHGGDR